MLLKNQKFNFPVQLHFLFCIAAQILPWVCQLQQFLQQLFFSLDICSTSTADSNVASDDSNRIVGGVRANISEVPYQLTLQIFFRHFCGAVLISPLWALSAAHCFPSHYPVPKMRLRGGTVEIPTIGYVYSIASVIIHSNFSRLKKIPINDIAAIKSATKFKFVKESMEPIPLPKVGQEIPYGTISIISGWGRMKENGHLSRYLRKAYIPIVWPENCLKSVPVGQFCAGYLQGGKGSCQGDSGGPLVVQNQLFGLVSWGKGCARPKFPAVFTDVLYYRK